MFGMEEALQNIASKWVTLIIAGGVLWALVMFLVSKITGSVKTGSFIAGGVVMVAIIWMISDGKLINYFININY